MVEYHHGMWIDCHDYDKININKLEEYPNAYSSFCWLNDNPFCSGDISQGAIDFSLDANIKVCDNLQKQEWSFIYNQDLTMRKMYDVRNWNVIYDLGIHVPSVCVVYVPFVCVCVFCLLLFFFSLFFFASLCHCPMTKKNVSKINALDDNRVKICE